MLHEKKKLLRHYFRRRAQFATSQIADEKHYDFFLITSDFDSVRSVFKKGGEKGTSTASGFLILSPERNGRLGPDVRGHGRGTFPSRVFELRRSVAGPPGPFRSGRGAGWAKLRALKSRPTGDRVSSEKLVNVRNGPE